MNIFLLYGIDITTNRFSIDVKQHKKISVFYISRNFPGNNKQIVPYIFPFKEKFKMDGGTGKVSISGWLCG